MMSSRSALIEALSNIVGSKFISDDLNIRLAYSRDASPEPPRLSDVVVRPSSTEEVSEIVKVANRFKTPIIIRGGGANLVGLPPGSGGITLDMTRMSNIVELDEASMTVTVQAGINWSLLTYELKKKGYRTPFYGPFSGGAATIGGGISNASVGLGSAKYGTVADILVGLEVVLPTGDVIRTGSGANPFAKKFTRWGFGPDMTGLFIGDQGVFGVKTEATLKIMPWPDEQAFGSYTFQDLEKACRAIYELQLRHIPTNIVLLEPDFNAIFGKAGFRGLLGVPFSVHIHIEGYSKDEVERQKLVADDIMKKNDGKEIPPDFPAWNFTRPWEWQPRTGPLGQAWTTACYKVPILDYPAHRKLWYEVLEKYKNVMKEKKIDFYVASLVVENTLDPMNVLYWFDEDEEAREWVRRIWRDLIENEIRHGAIHYWLGKVIGERVAKAYTGVYFDFLRTIKRALDPNGIMNPGLLLL
ncbi:MAG: FAD-binding oxidoreductase [Candidatus Nezhaarchaeota archaeon]|nr:FAD-binding oxidoreductase [Candidatus Nezhaarchaeota archaeon]MCX8142371.1 FAD-binding oxidoreductase [Candidatus Nezhaarchaeota archaeon]MDW8050656.1 FAD-binding oxidoreductase [Nitrososphaerota archaeon]